MQIDVLERHLPRLLDELADPHTPDYYDDLFWQTARTSQRPAWTIRERWLPMLDIARQPVTMNVPWRPIAVLALLIAALAASLLLAGARQKLPPLTGPAGNGVIALSRDGDVYTYDPRTGTSRAIVTCPDQDVDPVWSADGTDVAFRRIVNGSQLLFVARLDGSGQTQITPSGFSDIESYEISPDGDVVAIVAGVNGRPTLFVAKADASGIQTLETGSIVWGATFRPTGSDILFVGPHGTDGSYSGIYLIDRDGTNLRTLIEPEVDANISGTATWSPDGTRIAYSRWEPRVIQQNLRVHVMSADGTGDLIVGHADGACCESGPEAETATGWRGGPLWSPDGTKLLIERNAGPAGSPYASHPSTPVVATVDGNAPDVGIRFQMSINGVVPAWSPDGSAILATPLNDDDAAVQQLLWDPVTGGSRDAPWLAKSTPAWQRVAP
ncbi:MAG: TolB family protein [Chloroflexota bacterium]